MFSSALRRGFHELPRKPLVLNASWAWGTADSSGPSARPAPNGPAAKGKGKNSSVARGRVMKLRSFEAIPPHKAHKSWSTCVCAR